MKVYIVTNTPFPNGMAPANRIKCYAQALQSQGVAVEILIYFRTERYGVPPLNTEGEGMCHGVPFRYVGHTPVRCSNVLLRQYYDLRDRLDCLSYLRQRLEAGDVVLSYMGLDVDFALRVVRLAHTQRARFFHDLCELPYGTTQQSPKTLRLRRRTIERLSPQCDGHICISQALLDYIQPYSSPTAHNFIVPIMVDYQQYELPDRSAEASYPYIFHAGSLTEQKDGVLGMIEAFGMSQRSIPASVRFVLTGCLEKAKAANEIRAVIQRYGIEDRVVFTGYLTDDELRSWLSEASLVIINKYVTQQNLYCFSTKLGEYLAAGKPVIITRVGEAMNWLRDGETAFVVEPGDRHLMADAIVEAFTDEEKRAQIAVAGQALCRRSFDYLAWGALLVKTFNQ